MGETEGMYIKIPTAYYSGNNTAKTERRKTCTHGFPSYCMSQEVMLILAHLSIRQYNTGRDLINTTSQSAHHELGT